MVIILVFYTGLGYYHFDGNKWNYPNYFKSSTFVWNILDVVPNPSKFRSFLCQLFI